jgi:hypothetical protein
MGADSVDYHVPPSESLTCASRLDWQARPKRGPHLAVEPRCRHWLPLRHAIATSGRASTSRWPMGPAGFITLG